MRTKPRGEGRHTVARLENSLLKEGMYPSSSSFLSLSIPTVTAWSGTADMTSTWEIREVRWRRRTRKGVRYAVGWLIYIGRRVCIG